MLHARIFCFSVELCFNKFFVLSYSTSPNEKEVEVSLKQMFFPLIKKKKCFRLSCLPLLLAFAPAVTRLVSVWFGNNEEQVKPVCTSIVLLREERNASV